MDNSKKYIKIKDQLVKKSNYFCPAKWTELYLYLNHGNSNSCHHPIPHSIPSELLDDPFVLHNTPHKLKMQQLMIDGHRPQECHMCWHVEDEGVDSDRYIKSQQWADQIDSLEVDSHHVPQFIELVFDNLCNLSCSYCDSGQSSTWASKIQQDPINLISDYRELYRKIHITPGETKPEYLAAWLKWWPMIRNQVGVLKISGGEPLISPNFWKFFDILGKSPELRFHINSNLSVATKRLEKFANHSTQFKHIKIAASIDGQGKIAEYARKGLDFDLFLKNCEYWCEHTPSNCTLNFQSTVNILSVWGLSSFLELVVRFRQKYPTKIDNFYAGVVRFPEFQSINLLPTALKQHLASEIQHTADCNWQWFKSDEQSYITKIIGYLNSNPVPMIEFSAIDLKTDLKKFLQKYDQYDTLKYRQILPHEFVSWIDNDTE